MMNIHKAVELHECPYCGGTGFLDEEQDWCWYVRCLHCGAETAPLEYDTPEERIEAAHAVVRLWNLGKVIRSYCGD